MNRRSALPCVIALASLTLLLSGLLSAQGYGTIVGTVTDPSGAVVAGARIKATDEATSLSRETLSNDQGYFVLPSPRPSTYSLTIYVKRLTTAVRNGTPLQAAATVSAHKS